MSDLLVVNSDRFSDHEIVPEEVMPGLVGQAPALRDILARLPTLAKAEGAVLISGETGTGKELVARAIHRLSRRASYPFVAMNCGSLVDTLFESEVFGHERGAFTDAHARRQGLVAQAAGGTLLLDEIDTLSPRGQVALLRVLQDRTFRLLGSNSEHRADVRFLATTNAGLERLVQSGAFRADLYYRLWVFSVSVPPLRDRREDIPRLAEYFIRKYWQGSGAAPRLSGPATEALLACNWVGNVRELENAIVRALPDVKGGRIEVGDLGLPGVAGGLGAATALLQAPRSYKTQKRQVLDDFDRQYLLRLMTDHRGNVSQAAHEAGKERRDLGKLLKRHGFDPRQFASGTGAHSIAR